MGDLFKQKKQETGVQVVADPYAGVRSGLTSWLEQNIGKAGPTYTGDMVSKMSPYEEESLKWLKDYSAGGPSATRTAATGEINKTLSGAYADPTTSPYYQAMKAEAEQNQKVAQKSIADEAAGGGRYWTGARLKLQGEEAGKTSNYLNQILGTLSEAERQRMLQVLPYAQQFATQEEQAPLQKATALQSLGGLPRTIQDAYNQAIYNEWVATNRQWPMQIGQMASGVQQPPVYAQTGYSPSGAQQLAPWLGKAAQTAMYAAMFANPATAPAAAATAPFALASWAQ